MIDALVIEYRETKNELVFNEIYRELIDKQRKKFSTIARSINSNEADVIALYEDILMKCVEKWDGIRPFEHLYKFSIKRARANVYRNQSVRRNKESIVDPQDVGADKTAGATTEEAYIQNETLRIFKDMIEDEITLKIVETFLQLDKPSYAEISRLTGVNRWSVTRILKRLDTTKNRELLLA
ncbi:sigma-70 family RNA polymerase sigma factor [Bacillus altitudinis]|uniref:sigma-70 family RNA polymerase sigma factor n=1 Tax=Bacillus altitudinis TaxID=293387 RepID=UPI000465F5A4|nr:sigma-70 family RNA polymerase sigma factor [Bacillus altitudinis]MDR4198282.1 sigma-70 family RNA polymerase sigma factor [Bacillus altitudinis]